MALRITPHAADFGAKVECSALASAADAGTLNELMPQIRAAWLQHQVLYFPQQPLAHAQLSAFTLALGDWGAEPYLAGIESSPHIVEIKREAEEQASPFGSAWHSDWSFRREPPAATILHSKVIPPLGGDTLFADGYRAYEALPASLQKALAAVEAVHSARRSYSHAGFLAGGGDQRSMSIRPNDNAYATQRHPVLRTHPETGRIALWINRVYTIDLVGPEPQEAQSLLNYLLEHSVQEQFIYRHRWQPDMLALWDNRSVQHCAQGGYDGHRRLLHRTTVAGNQPYFRSA